MLFYKLYNWIKYKTLPSSFLFKNRLFIERDSKHKKIINNFGLIFRNSKWSMHENTNVNVDFKIFFFKICMFFILFAAIFFSIINGFMSNNFFINNLSFFFWLTLDSFDYYFSFIIWSIFSFFSLTFSKLYFFINNYQLKNFKNLNNMDNATNVFKFDDYRILSENNLYFLSKSDVNWITYSWLTSKNFNQKNKFIEFFFDSKISKNVWEINFNFFSNLYKTIFFLNLNKNNAFLSFFSLNTFMQNKFKELLPLSNINFFFNNYFSLIYSFYFKNLTDSNFLYENNFLKKNINWNLKNIPFNSFKDTTGLFFLDKFFFNDLSKNYNLNTLIFFQNLIVKNNLNSLLIFSKINRWLYRYSLLHRHSFKSIQKFTFIKKLLNSGFYNSSVFKKNLWNSVYFTFKKNNSNQLTYLLDINFNDFFKNNFSLFNKKLAKNNFLHKDGSSFFFFKFFENSYLWNLKRFFLFNGLSNNLSFLKTNDLFVQRQNFIDVEYENKELNFFYYNFFLKNRFFFFKSLNLFFFLNEDSLNNNLKSTNFDLYEDTFNFSSDFDLFSKDNLVSLNDLTLNFLHDLNFFNLNYADLNYNSNFFFQNKNIIKLPIKSIFTNDFIFFKNSYFYCKDLFLLNFYLK